MPFEHGGDIYTLPEGVLDFSVNLNPMGPPECMLEAARESIDDCFCYPDPYCRRLRQAIAFHDRVLEDYVLCASGASDLICRLAAGAGVKKTVLPVPCFSEYEKALQVNGCKVVFHPLDPEQNFSLTSTILEEIQPDIELVLLCQPNNPTGRLIEEGLLKDILARCREVGALLAVDQCFLPLSDWEGDDLTGELEGGNLLLIRALTKSYAVPGLRLGYALCADRALLARLSRCGPAWPVSLPAQAAGIAALTQEPDWPQEALPFLRSERERISRFLEELGCTVVPSQTNFILFQAPGDETLQKRLLDQGILIRSCANFRGLGPDWYRVAVRLLIDNQRLIDALAWI